MTWDKWTKPDVKGDIPIKRSGHTFVVIDTKDGMAGYMFGGVRAKTSPPGPNNELYKLDLGDKYWTGPLPLETTKDCPPERWNHTAMKWGKNMLVSGGFTKHKHPRYFADLWMFDTSTEQWSPIGMDGPVEPGSTAREWSQSNGSPGPSPRGAHATALVGALMYVFGGYGGNSWSRHDYNDLHALSLETWEWTDVECKGEPPEPRSGHQLCAIPGALYVCGGWNSLAQFDDLQLLDLDTLTWTAIEGASGEAWGPRRWNFTAIPVFSVPNWKLFVFGGNTGDLNDTSQNPQGTFVNDIVVLDCGSKCGTVLRWSVIRRRPWGIP
jgi:dynein heavy chain